MPSGHLKPGEQPAAGWRREIAEELGMSMDRCTLLHAEAFPIRHLTLYYRVEVQGTFTPSQDVSAVRWSLWNDLPSDLPADQRRAILLALA